MPSLVSMHRCNKCGCLYEQYHEAAHCESQPDVPILFPAGSIISFEDEASGCGSRFSYSSRSGPVLMSYLDRQGRGMNSRHIRVYIVSVNDNWSQGCEVAVFKSEEEGMISPAEYKFQSGYAADKARRLMMENRIHADLGTFGPSNLIG